MRKKIGSANVEYIVSGTNIIQEKRANYTLTFLYDGNGTLIGFNYKAGTTNADYYYGIDNFGNINYIYDANGNIVVTYKYDAWGKAISTTGSLASTIGVINPYRYKSYYFDTETNLYYLQSRYYDAGVQRFISADDTQYLGESGGVYSYNLYSYCKDDPINNYDKSGYWISNIIKFNPFGMIIDSIIAVKSRLNFNNNSKRSLYEGDGKLIYNQSAKDVNDVKYGITTLDGVGCEVISVYNAMVLLGYKPSLSKILLEFENNEAQWLWGTMGTNPYQLYRYFIRRKIKYKTYYTASSLEKSVKEGDIIILSRENYNFWRSGIHTIAIKYQNGKYIPYNDGGDDSHEYPKNTINELLDGRSFWVAYILGR